MKTLTQHIKESFKIGKNKMVNDNNTSEEKKAIEIINSLGNYNVISLKDVPSKFDGYVEIKFNKFTKEFSIGWNFNYGCPRESEEFKTPDEVVKYLKANKIDLSQLKTKADPDLTNGM